MVCLGMVEIGFNSVDRRVRGDEIYSKDIHGVSGNGGN
jgi:hypothetical protein